MSNKLEEYRKYLEDNQDNHITNLLLNGDEDDCNILMYFVELDGNDGVDLDEEYMYTLVRFWLNKYYN